MPKSSIKKTVKIETPNYLEHIIS